MVMSIDVSSGTISWQSLFTAATLQGYTVRAVTSETATGDIACAISITPLVVVILNSDGTEQEAFKDTTTYTGSLVNSVVQSSGIYMNKFTSSVYNMVYLSMQNPLGSWQIVAFWDFAPVSATAWSDTSTSSQALAIAVSETNIYFTGQVNDGSYTYFALYKYSHTPVIYDLSYQWAFTGQNTAGSSWSIRRVTFYDNTLLQGSTNNILVACSEISSADNVRFHFFQIDRTAENLQGTPNHWQVNLLFMDGNRDMNNGMMSCSDVRMVNYTLAVAITNDKSGYTWFCQITNWDSTGTFTCSTQQSLLYPATIMQGYALTDYGYYVGYFLNNTQYIGFLMSTNTTSACVNLSSTSMTTISSISAIIVTDSSLSIMASVSFSMSYLYPIALSNTQTLVGIVNQCTNYKSTVSMAFATNISSPINYCLNASPLYVAATFSIQTYCYECSTLSPQGISLTSISPTSTSITTSMVNSSSMVIKTQSSTASDAGTYVIKLKGTDPMSNLQTESITISILDNTNCQCATFSCSYSSQTSLTYISNQGWQRINLMNETLSTASCGSTFQTSCSSNGSYNPTNITYSLYSGVNITYINLETIDDSLLGSFLITCSTILSSSGLEIDQCSASFSLDIEHSCTNSVLTLSYTTISSTYDISQFTSQDLYQFALAYSPATCIPVYYIWTILSDTNSTTPFSFSSSTLILSVDTSNSAYVGFYYLKLKVQLTDSTGDIIYSTTTSSLTVNITDQCASATVYPDEIVESPYSVLDGAKTFSFSDWNISYTTVTCTPFTYTVTMNNSAISLYSFIQYNATSQSFTLNSSSISDVGYYALNITGVLVTLREVPYIMDLSLINPCLTNEYNTTIFSDQLYYLRSNSMSIPFSFLSSQSKYQSFCGNFVYLTAIDCGSYNSSNYVTMTSSSLIVYNDTYIPSPISKTPIISISCIIGVRGYQGSYSTNTQYSKSFKLTIVDPCIPTLVTAGSIYSNSSTAYFVSFTQQTIYFTSFTYLDSQSNDNNCGSIAYSLNYDDSENDGSAIFSTDGTSINVYTDDESLAGVYTVTIVGTLPYYLYAAKYDFTYTICAIEIPSLGNIYYQITADPLIITIPSFIPYASAGCPTLTYIVYQDGSKKIDSSLFTLKYETESIILTVSTSDFEKKGTYNFEVTSSFEDSSYSISFDVNVICVTTELTYTKIDDVKLAYSDPPTRYYFDEYTQDPQCLNAVIYTSLLQSGNPLPSFIKLTQAKRFYTVTPTSKSDIGLYVINLLATVRNLNGQITINNNLLWNLYILENSTGISDITITNSPGQKSNNGDSSSNSEDTNFEQTVSQNLTAQISSISFTGLTTIKFSNPITIPNNYSKLNSSVLDISVIPQSDNIDSKYYQLNWTITSFNQTYMVIQVNFQYPQYASGQQMSISFSNNSLFKEVTTQKEIRPGYKAYKQIPPMIGNDCNDI